MRFAACDLGLPGGGVLLGDIGGPEIVSASAGARLERILGAGTLVGGSVVTPIADAGRGGPSTPADAARGGANPADGGGGTLEALIPGEAV